MDFKLTNAMSFISVENEILFLVSGNSDKIFVFDYLDDFNKNIDKIAGFNLFIDKVSEEVHAFEAVFSNISNENKIHEILLRLLFLYKQYKQKNNFYFNKYEFNHLKYAVEGIHNKGLFMPIFNSSSLRVRNEALWIFKFFNEANSDDNKNDRNHAYRSLTVESDKIISSICSDILEYYKKDFYKVKESKRLDKVISLLYNDNDVKKVNNISNQLKNIKEINKKRLDKAIGVLQETDLPAKDKLVKMLTHLDLQSKEAKNKLSNIINIFNNIKIQLSNYKKVITGQFNILQGFKGTCNGITKMFSGINSIRNGFDGSHGSDIYDIDPSDYKSEAILSLNTTMAISKYLIDKFRK